MNRSALKIVNLYAKTLFELAKEQGQLPIVYQDMAGIAKLVDKADDFRKFLADPRVVHKQQRAIIQDLFQTQVSKLTYHFLLLLIDKNKISFLSEICRRFESFHLEAQNVLKVKLISYQELADTQVTEICRKLNRHFRKNIHPETQRDPGLLGGFKIQAGDKIYDFSIQKQLERFRQAVMAA